RRLDGTSCQTIDRRLIDGSCVRGYAKSEKRVIICHRRGGEEPACAPCSALPSWGDCWLLPAQARPPPRLTSNPPSRRHPLRDCPHRRSRPPPKRKHPSPSCPSPSP